VDLSGDKFFEPPGSQREWLQQVMFGVFPEVVAGTVGKMWSVMGWDCWAGLGVSNVFFDDWGDGFHFFWSPWFVGKFAPI